MFTVSMSPDADISATVTSTNRSINPLHLLTAGGNGTSISFEDCYKLLCYSDIAKTTTFLDISKGNNGKFVSDSIKKVIFNDPCTIVLWKDGTKTVVKCNKSDTYSKEAGLMACVIKRLCGNKGNFNDIFREFCGE